MKKVLPAILLFHTAALTLNPTNCHAYQVGSPLIRAITKDSTFPARTMVRRGDLGQTGSHRRCTTVAMKRSGITTDDSISDTVQIPSSTEDGALEFSGKYNDWFFDDRKQRVAFYGSLAFLETIFWYFLAPGIDPQSRWFNPVDGKLISNLLEESIKNPELITHQPPGETATK